MAENAPVGHHILSRFDEDLEKLRSGLMEMGGLVETQLQLALQSFERGDAAAASQVIHDELRVNQMEVEIDDLCSKILATRSPTASDLRYVMSIIKIITDLERIGDEAHKIALIGSRRASLGRASDWYRVLRNMGREAMEVLHVALDVLARLDAEAARRNVGRDRVLDGEYEAVQRQCITFMIEDPRTIRAAIDLLWIARALERVGDHAKNICEYVIFMVGGQDVRHSRRAGGADGG